MTAKYRPVYRKLPSCRSIARISPRMLKLKPKRQNGASLMSLSEKKPMSTDTMPDTTRIGAERRFDFRLLHPNVARMVGVKTEME